MAMQIENEMRVPAYEPDDGPLTDAQYEAIRAVSSASDTPDFLFTECLFGFDKITC